MTGSGSAREWVVRPLFDAGLDPDELRALLTRVTFECLMTGGRCDLSDLSAFLGPQPPAVRAAWVETVGRMLSADDLDAAGLPEPR